MNHFSNFKKTIWFILISIIGLTIYLSLSDDYIEILNLDKKGLSKYFHENDLDSTNIAFGVEKKALKIFPESTSVKIKIKNEILNNNKKNPSGKTPTFRQLQVTLQFLYLLFTEEMTIKKRPAFFKSLPLTIQQTLISSNIWFPLCDDISVISSNYLKKNNKFIQYADTLFIPYIRHYITGVVYKDSNKTYITGMDFQNGFIGPIDSITQLPLTLNELRRRIKYEDFSGLQLLFLDNTTLKNKKTLIPKKYPTNLFPERDFKIYKTNYFQLYPATRRTYSTHYYIWFYLGLEDKEKMMREITKQLALIVPEKNQRNNKQSNHFY